MLERVEEYLDGVDFENLTFEELEHYINCICAIEKMKNDKLCDKYIEEKLLH